MPTSLVRDCAEGVVTSRGERTSGKRESRSKERRLISLDMSSDGRAILAEVGHSRRFDHQRTEFVVAEASALDFLCRKTN